MKENKSFFEDDEELQGLQQKIFIECPDDLWAHQETL